MWSCCVRRRASSGIACTFGERARDRTHHLDDKTDKTEKIEVHTHVEHTLPLAYIENTANYRLYASACFICFAFSFTVLLLHYFRDCCFSFSVTLLLYTLYQHMCLGIRESEVDILFYTSCHAHPGPHFGGPAGPKNIRANIGDSSRRVLPSARSSCF